jgi:hypothetical protein
MNPDKSFHEEDRACCKRITRRSFIQLVQCAGVGALFNWNKALGQIKPSGGGRHMRYVPSLPGRLVHVHDSDATFWNFNTGWYGYYVDQTVVDTMVEVGLLKLTNAKNLSSAWRRLVPRYVPGQTFSIKVNFNNYSSSGPDPDPDINALIEPVNALIRTLVLFGVPESDITVYDVTDAWHSSAMPMISFINRCLYPGVKFVYHKGNPDPFSATEFIQFNTPGSPYIPDMAICNAVVNADYLINMFLPKAHALAGVTLGFKNHMGSFERCQYLHNWLPYNYYYNPNYSTFVDLFKNPHFRAKTVLTMCDGLFGNWKGVNGTPQPWITFGNKAPNSLFFSADPVAIDSVPIDYIEFERVQQGLGTLMPETRDYLALSEAEGWGIHEQGDPWKMPVGSDYKRIKYIYIDGV